MGHVMYKMPFFIQFPPNNDVDVESCGNMKYCYYYSYLIQSKYTIYAQLMPFKGQGHKITYVS